METSTQRPRIIVIVGPTASGKSDLALEIAKKFNGEIIAADSRTIYKGMNIGTAKPSAEEQKLVPHWGLDLIRPGQSYSAAKFKKYAEEKINDIQRNKLPILVGGTGLYVDSVLFDFSFVKTTRFHRLIYSSWSIEKLQKTIYKKSWPIPENLQNKRHLIAVVARRGHLGAKNTYPLKEALVVGIKPSGEVLKKRIQERVDKYMDNGLIGETEQLLGKYGEKKIIQNCGIAYLAAIKVIRGEITQQEAKEVIQKQEWQYARRQKTWFKRNKFINWFDDSKEAYKYIASILNN